MLIIPGPKEPHHFEPYLKSLVEELKAYGPAGEHIIVCRNKPSMCLPQQNLGAYMSVVAGGQQCTLHVGQMP